MAYQSRLELAIDSRSGERDLRRFDRQLGKVESSGDRVSNRLARMRGFAVAAGGALAGMSAGAGVLALMANQASRTAQEIENLARVAGTTPEQFQRMAFGAAAYNIEQQKLADILRDTQDRIGDFLQTGAGEFADFFEGIAPQIGLTADELARMSGPEALQAIYSALEQANLSASEMTFYMEALASDATELIPLLRDGGTELERFAREADDLNAVLSNLEIQRLRDIRAEFHQLEQQLSTETARAVSQFDELMKSSLEGISEGVNLVARGFNSFMDDFRENEAKRSIAGIDAELERLFDNKARLEERIDLFGADAPQSQDAVAALEELRQEYGVLIDRKKELQQAGSPVSEPEIVDLDRATLSARDHSDSLDAVTEAADAAAEAEKAFGDSLLALQDRLFPAEAAQRNLREGQMLLQTALMQGKIGIERYLEAWERLNTAQSREITGGFMEQVASGGIAEGLDKSSEAAERFGLTFSSALEDAIVNFEDLGDVAAGFFTDLQRMIVRTQITEPLGDAIGGFDWGGMIGGLFSGAGGGATVDTSGVAALGYNTGSFSSGGYTGDGGRLDPAGIVHRGEFVVKKSVVDNPGVRPMLERLNKGYADGGYVGGAAAPVAGGSPVTVQVIDQRSGGEQPEVEETRGADGRRMIRVLIREEMRGAFNSGVMDRDMARNYGIRRRGN